MLYFLVLFAFIFTGCSTKGKKNHGEYIYRHHNEFFFTPPPAQLRSPHPYPWEDKFIGQLPRITKEFFRCRGDSHHPVVIQQKEGKEPIKYFDCEGSSYHGLPLKEGKEFVYPCLLDILNYIQEETEKRVIVTCGHRCPKHNAYSDPSPSNWGSKHMLGAEVDFYVETMEQQPEAIVDLIQQYYAPTDPQFHRYSTEKVNVSTPPWYNKEIFIKLYLPHEGRDFDNQHPYPYIGIQVRNDNATKVTFDPKQAENYLRH